MLPETTHVSAALDTSGTFDTQLPISNNAHEQKNKTAIAWMDPRYKRQKLFDRRSIDSRRSDGSPDEANLESLTRSANPLNFSDPITLR